MIQRYTRERMAKIWSDENRFRKWLEIEILVCEALAELGEIPEEAVQKIRQKASFDVRRIAEIEAEVKHDVVAFLTNIGEYVGPESRYIHLGLTSSDILDTSIALLLREASDIIIEDLEDLSAVLKEMALEYRDTVMIGRTHGVHAEPITFGLKIAIWYQEAKRNIERMQQARDMISVGKISGAVGTFAHVDPRVEEYVCKRLGLKPDPVSSQIVQRDRHAQFFTTLAIVGTMVEKIATEIRHLQRTEVLEAEEFFSRGQKGSSAMPHKRNPVLSENLCGLARMLRAYSVAALEDVALWHERDISHSSVERIIGPDATILLDFMLARLKSILDRLVVYPDRMMENLQKTKGLFFSESIMLALTRKGVLREDAYRWVQRNATKVWEEGQDFKRLISTDEDITRFLTKQELDQLFDVKKMLANVNRIIERALNTG